MGKKSWKFKPPKINKFLNIQNAQTKIRYMFIGSILEILLLIDKLQNNIIYAYSKDQKMAYVYLFYSGNASVKVDKLLNNSVNIQ